MAVPGEIWGAVFVYLTRVEVHTVCLTSRGFMCAARVTVRCLGDNRCCLSSDTMRSASVGILHVHGPILVPHLLGTLQTAAPSAICTLGRPDERLFWRIMAALRHCDVDVHIAHQMIAAHPQDVTVTEPPGDCNRRRLVCHFQDSLVLVPQLAALRAALQCGVSTFEMRMERCRITFGQYGSRPSCTQARVVRLRLSCVNHRRSSGNQGIAVYVVLDCILHRLLAPHMQEFTLRVQQDDMQIGDWVGCMHVVTFFLAHSTATRPVSAYVEFSGLHYGRLDTICHTIGSLLHLIDQAACSTITLALHFASVSNEAHQLLCHRLLRQSNNFPATFRVVENGIVICAAN